jgi:hypothetical protein
LFLSPVQKFKAACCLKYAIQNARLVLNGMKHYHYKALCATPKKAGKDLLKEMTGSHVTGIGLSAEQLRLSLPADLVDMGAAGMKPASLWRVFH